MIVFVILVLVEDDKFFYDIFIEILLNNIFEEWYGIIVN